MGHTVRSPQEGELLARVFWFGRPLFLTRSLPMCGWVIGGDAGSPEAPAGGRQDAAGQGRAREAAGDGAGACFVLLNFNFRRGVQCFSLRPFHLLFFILASACMDYSPFARL